MKPRRHTAKFDRRPARDGQRSAHRRPTPPPATRETPPPPTRTSGVVEGVLELYAKGFGFLRNPAKNYAVLDDDPYVSEAIIRRYELKGGLRLSGQIEAGRGGQGLRLTTVDTIEGQPLAEFKNRDFDRLTPIDPRQWIRLETGPQPMTTRVMDLLTPIGKGQRGLIVAPPRTGKTILLQHVALAVAQNHPEMVVLVLLVDERPEEVTEMRRTIKGEVIASSSDFEVAQHIRLSELVLERAKRLAEQGKDVFLLLDSLTRLARAYNKQVGTSGRTMTGGIDVHALETPKRLFGTARTFDEGGSLTILGTALIETGSRMDDIIFQEFKGTGNMELVLERRLAERRIFPAIDIGQSGTRKEERLLPPETIKRIYLLRRSLANLNPIMAMESLVKALERYPTNAEFLDHVGEFVKS